MKKPIINLDELEYTEFGSGDKFHASRAPVSPNIGGKKLGYAVIRLEPGKRAWPYHSHHVIEEMFYILEGSGTLRHAGEEYPLRAGDFVASPAEPDQPHQIVNTSDKPLTYIAMSTQEDTDVMLYPDSGKYGVWHGNALDRNNPRNFAVFARKNVAVDYWDGESD
ncbi:MAG: cupin domain-containing protein [Gammaproteobacteria bacterium]|nr:cupin domain-containing protein [Gammaproteobacteria bacterium]